MMCPDCGKEIGFASWPFPCKGRGHALGSYWTGPAACHPSERTVVYQNPQTGEYRVPGRADRPIHPKYQAAGFTERVEFNSIHELKGVEKSHGLRAEVLNYDKNSARSERDLGIA